MKNANGKQDLDRLYFDADKDQSSMQKQSDMYAGVYGEIAELLDEASVMVLWKYFRGTTVNFPQKLYDQTYVRQYIKDNMNKKSAYQMAYKLGLTERRIRQIMKEVKDEEQGGK